MYLTCKLIGYHWVKEGKKMKPGRRKFDKKEGLQLLNRDGVCGAPSLRQSSCGEKTHC